MMEELRDQNPAFSKLLNVLENVKLEDGQLKTTVEEITQARAGLHSVKQRYLEQLLLSTELESALHTITNSPPSECMAAARLHHRLGACPPGETLLGVTDEHLRAVDPTRGLKKYKKEVLAELEQRLRSKVARVLEWHTPEREVSGNESLQLAKMKQLPQLLRQQVDEVRRNKEEIEVMRQEMADVLAAKHKVLVEMCLAVREYLEREKLGVVREANEVELEHITTQCAAMTGKLDVMYHQLLKGITSEGRLEALKEIKSHLESARTKLDERLAQSQQMVSHYQALGESFTSLAEQYHEILTDIENKQWALTELTKTTS